MWPPPASAAQAACSSPASCSSAANAEAAAGNKARAMSARRPSQGVSNVIGLCALACVSRAGSGEASRRREWECRDRHVGAPESVAHRVRDGAAEAGVAALAETTQAQRIGSRPDLLVEAVDRWNVGGERQGVVHEG